MTNAEAKQRVRDIITEVIDRDAKYVVGGVYIRWGAIQRELVEIIDALSPEPIRARRIETMKTNNENQDLRTDEISEVIGSITIDGGAIKILQGYANRIISILNAVDTLCNWHGKAKIRFVKRNDEIEIISGPPHHVEKIDDNL